MTLDPDARPHFSPPQPIDRGVAGASGLHGLDRRTTSRRRWTRARWRERRLGNHLDRRLGLFAVVLHDRGVPLGGRRIDHLVVAATGVWIISGAHHRGQVRRGRTDAIVDMEQSAEAVGACLESIGFDWVDVHRVVCFTNGDWRPFAKPFRADDTWVTRPKALTAQIAASGPLAPRDLQTVAAALSSTLPAAVGSG